MADALGEKAPMENELDKRSHSPKPSPRHSLERCLLPPGGTDISGANKSKMELLGKDMQQRLVFKYTSTQRERIGSSSKVTGVRTVASCRGSSKTHTYYLQLQRTMGLLMSLHPNPQATAFQRRRDDLRRSIENVLMHLSEDENKDIDPHFSEDLEQLLQLAEHLLDEVDYEGDKREEAGNRQKHEKKLNNNHLPKMQSQKLVGTKNMKVRFKEERRSTTEHAKSEKNLECTFCKGAHFNHQCDGLDEMDLNKVEELQLCPHCLWDKHDKECPHIKKATFLCKKCKFHYKLKKLHLDCKNQGTTTPEPALE